MRAEACNTLGKFSSRRVVKPLLERVAKDNKRYVRSAALYALKRIDKRKNIKKLFDQFAQEKEPVFKDQLRIVLRSLIGRHL